MTRYLTMAMTVFAVLAAGTSGQEGSPLALELPLGMPSLRATGPAHAFAGTGAGVTGRFYGLSANPANLGFIDALSFSALATVDIAFVETSEDAQTRFVPRLLSLVLPPFLPGTFGFSVTSRSTTDFNRLELRQPGVAPGDTLSMGLASDGGLTAWEGGWGMRVARFVSIGLSYERLFFRNDLVRIVALHDSVPRNFLDSTHTRYRGNGLRAGILVPLGTAVAGLSAEYVFEATAKRTTAMVDDSTSVTTREFPLHLPPAAALGASWQIVPEWLVAADLGGTFWNLYSSGIPLGIPVDNAYGVSVGGQFIPSPNLLSPRYWEIVRYQAGLRYAQLPSVTGSEAALTLGVGLPLQQGGGLANLVIEYARRSGGIRRGYTEQLFGIGLGINGSSGWFTKESTVRRGWTGGHGRNFSPQHPIGRQVP